MAINIARPATLVILHPVIVIDGEVEREQETSPTVLDGVLRKATEIGWPTIADLPIMLVSEWLRKLPGITESWGNGRLGRSVAGFSHLVYADFSSDVMMLLWILLGLEALYCSSTEGLKQQLVERSAILLGRPINFKKALSDAYNIRSSLVHGGLDMPMKHFMNEWHDNTYENLSNAIDVTGAVLLATLQEMAKRNLHELTFEQSLKVPNQPVNLV